MNKLCSRSGAL